jgi:hypothetical protein
MNSTVPFVVCILFVGLISSTPLALSNNVNSASEKYQTLEPGIHGTSQVSDVKITGVTITGDNEISVDLRYTGPSAASPPVVIVASALTNRTEQSALEGSQTLNLGWSSPNSLIITVNGSSSLYDANLVSVVASPYGSPSLALSNANKTLD